MAETKKPLEEVSTEDAAAMFANAAKALGGDRGRSAGFRRVSIPVEEPVRPEPLPLEEPPKAKTKQSERGSQYLRRREEEEAEEVRVYELSEPASEAPEEQERYDFAATTVIPSAVTFDYGEEYDEEYDEEELTNEMLEEEIAFSALAAALDRHADVYGDPRKNRKNRYHDYGFGMGITFDGPSYDDDDEDDI